jgi:peptidoglycan/xylan/chitin deacetylase (PgdA/CDA1 family)
LNTLSEAELTKELAISKGVLENLTGQKINLLRPPNGAYDNRVISIANEQGYRVIQWSVDSLDWKRPGVEAIVNNIINGRQKNKGASPGDILLFHASDSAPDTPNALPIILKTLKGKKYELVPVGILLQNAKESWPPGSSL